MRLLKYMVLGVLCLSVICGPGYLAFSKVAQLLQAGYLVEMLGGHYVFTVVSFGSILALLFIMWSVDQRERRERS